MLSFLNKRAKLTEFDQCRILLTVPDLQCPNRFALHKLTQIFNAQDVETKAQIAFATLINEAQKSDERNNWLYLIKNLIILDRLVEQQLFLNEIFALSLPSVDNFKQNKNNFQFYDSQRKVKMFWKIIKQMSGLLVSKMHIFYFKRSQRMDFLSKLTPSQVLQQISSIQCFFRLIFQFTEILSGHKLSHQNHSQASKILKCHKQLQEKGTLLSYLYLQIYHKLTLCYSCQLQCNNRFLALLSDKSLGKDDLRLFVRMMIKFKANSNKYITFIQQHKKIEGIEEMHDKQLIFSQNDDIVKLIQQFIQQKSDEGTPDQLQVDQIYSKKQLTVERSPLSSVDNSFLVARLHSKNNNKATCWQQNHKESSYKTIFQNKQENTSNVFFDWDKAYSDQFPQNEIMTVDLILILKAEEQSEDDQEVNQYQLIRSCDCKLAEIQMTSVDMKNKMKPGKSFTFQNIFSGPLNKWNLY